MTTLLDKRLNLELIHLVIRRVVQSVLCFAIAASLTNGLLLVMQLYAWTTMVQDRAPDMGYTQAIFTSIEGQELCGVCLIVIDESAKQQNDERQSQNLELIVKALSASDGNLGDANLRAPNRIYLGSLEDSSIVPQGLPGARLRPPPRGILS